MNKNTKLFIILLCVAFGMVGFAYAFVPLYSVLCQVLGIPTATVKVGEAGVPKPVGEISDRVITVRFMGNNANGIPIDLQPVDKQVKLRLGESVLTAYKATSHSDEFLKGVAVHTIMAQGVGEQEVSEYVDLQQCFCFEEQMYPPKEEVNLPLSFHITPDLPETVHTIVFGYTLYEAEEG